VLGAAAALGSCRLGYEELPVNVFGDNGSTGNGATADSGGASAEAGATASAGSATSGGTLAGVAGDAAAGAPDMSSAGAPGTTGGSSNGGSNAGSGGNNGGSSAGIGGNNGGTGGSSAGTGGGSGGSGSGTCQNATYGGHAYRVCTTAKNFVDAAVDCAFQGFRLARIDDAAEQTWVHSTIPIADQNNNSNTLWRWLGADDNTNSGDWSWSDGTLFWSGGAQGAAVGGAYTNWNKGHPLSNGNCGAMEARVGAWYAEDCTGARPYVCEQY